MIPIRGSTLRISLIGIFLLPLLAPGASAATYSEGFESFNAFDTPSSDSYTFSTSGTGSAFVVESPAVETRSLKVATTTGNTFAAIFTSTTANDCTTAGQTSAEFKFRMAQLPNVGASYKMGIQSAAGEFNNVGEYILFSVIDTGAVNLVYHDNGGSDVAVGVLGITLSVDNWYTFQIECSPTTIIYRETTTATQVQTTATLNLGKTKFIQKINTAGATLTTYLDDLVFGTPPATNSGSRFCANPSVPPDFEYHFVDGWSFYEDDQPVEDIGTNDGFSATTGTTETAWMGKGFTTGSRSFSTIARIEAAVEGAESIFGIGYTLGAGGLPATGNKGSGLEAEGADGGNFDNSVQVVFVEDGNDWNIKIVQNIAGTLTQIGASIQHGNPNQATTYNFTIDTRESVGRTVQLRDANGAILLFRNLDSSFSEDAIKDQWFLASANLVVLFQAITVLDDADQDEIGATGIEEDSTCIFDLIGESTVAGGAGIQPPSSIPDEEPEPTDECQALFCPPEGGIGGLSSEALSLFLGIVLIASFAASMNEKTGAGAAGLAIFALLGVFLAFALGYIPLWVVLVLFAIGLGAIFLGLFKGSGSEGM